MSREDLISRLPMEDIVWIIKETKRETKTDLGLEENRYFVVHNEKGNVLGSVQCNNHKGSPTFQLIYNLVCQTVLSPPCRKPRRPRFLTFDEQETFAIAKEQPDKWDKLRIILFYGDRPSSLFHNKLVMYECSNCHLRGTDDLFHLCSQCQAARYCSVECGQEDWDRGGSMESHSHKKWCDAMRSYMDIERELADFPFPFKEETTARDFNSSRLKEFLKRCNLYNVGLWRHEHQSNNTLTCASELGEPSNADTSLPDEQMLLLGLAPQSLHQPITDWLTYYTWRGFKLNSPVAILLSYPLTLYYVITSALPEHFPDLFADIPKLMNIHILGVEREVEMFAVFKELGHLLPEVTIEIQMFGKRFQRKLNGSYQKENNISVRVHRKLYHKYSGAIPHLTIAFNAGIGAYATWNETLKKLQDHSIPAYFTDYCQYSCEWSKLAIQYLGVGTISKPRVNPFRSPIRKFCEEHCMPWYNNGFLFYIDYKQK